MQSDLRRWMTVAQQMVLCESAKGWESDPHVQFHLSVEPDLIPGKPFSEQQRTVSADGARGAALGDGIYTTRNPQYWLSQLAYEGVGEVPRYIYLVWVRDPSTGDFWSAHQDVSSPSDVIVLGKLMELPDDDEPLAVGGLFWLADKFVQRHDLP